MPCCSLSMARLAARRSPCTAPVNANCICCIIASLAVSLAARGCIVLFCLAPLLCYAIRMYVCTYSLPPTPPLPPPPLVASSSPCPTKASPSLVSSFPCSLVPLFPSQSPLTTSQRPSSIPASGPGLWHGPFKRRCSLIHFFASCPIQLPRPATRRTTKNLTREVVALD